MNFFFTNRYFFLIYLSISILLVTTCDLLAPGLGEVIDISAPELQIVSPPIEPMDYVGSDFTISGTVSDDIAVSKVLVSWPGLEKEAVIDDTNWTVTVPFSSISDLGPVVFKVVATDSSGKETLPAYRTITIDNSAPTVLVTAPQVFNPGPSNSNYIVIGGELWDSSPINFIRLEVIDPASPETPVFTQLADGERLWSARIEFDSSAIFATGTEYLYRIIAEDAAGNINTYQYHNADFWTRLSAGESFPVMSDIGGWDQYGDSLSGFTSLDRVNMQIHHDFPDLELDFIYNSDIDIPVISLSNLDKDEPIVANNSIGQSVPIYASATDDKEGIDRDSVSLNVFSVDLDIDIPASEFTSPGNGLYTSFQFDLSGPNILDPGPYIGTLTLEDNKGVAATLSFSFLINKGAPSIISLNPSSTYAPVDADGDLNVDVVISDDNPDAVVSAVASDIDGNPLSGVTSSVLVSEHMETFNGEDVYQSTHTLTLAGPVPDDVTVEVLVTDNSGVKSSRTVNYTIDRDNPAVVISVPSDGDIISGTALTTAGTSSDTGSNVFNVEVFVSEGNITTPPANAVWLNAEGNTTWSLPVDLSSGSEGDYTIFAKSFDAAGNEGVYVFSNFYYDLAVPSISMDGGTVKEYQSADFTLSGTLADTNGLVELTVFSAKDGGTFSEVAGSPFVKSGTSGTWSLPVTVDNAGADDGLYEYEFIITDVAGKTSTLSKTIVIDATAPELIVSNLADGDSVNTNAYTILGLVSDFSGIENDQIEYELNNSGTWQTIDVERTGNWELSVSGLAEGAGNSITFRAADILGSAFTIPTIYFGLDLNPPALTISEMALDGTFVGGDFVLSGTTGDVNGIDHMAISTDGGLAYSILGAYSSADNTVLNWTTSVTVPADGTEDGNHVIRIKTIDNYNKETIESLSIKYDATAPFLNFSNIADAMLITATPFLVNGTSSDNGGSGVTEVQYSFDNVLWNTVTGTVNWSESVPFTLGLGSDIFFKAIDAVNNESAVETITLNIDLQLPETDGNWAGIEYRGAPFNLTGTADDDLGVTSVTVTGEGAGAVSVAGNNGDPSRGWSVPVTPAADGTYEYVIRVTDSAGRYQDFSRTVAYDTTAPELLVSNLSEGDSVESNSYTIRGTATDVSGITIVEYNLNGGGWSPVTGTLSWSQAVTGLTEGAGNAIQFRTTDNSGLVTTLTAINFGLDLNPPALTISNKATYDGTWQNSLFTLSGTSTDANGLRTIEISTDGGSTYSTISGFSEPAWTANVTIPADGSEDGNHVIRVKSIDTYNKETIESLTVKYDTTPPTFALTNLVDEQLITDLSFLALGSWSDNGGSGTVGGSADVRYRIGAGSWTSFSTISASVFASTFASLSEVIDETISFRAYDFLGNESEETTVNGVDVDTALPVLTETFVNSEDSYYDSSTVVLTGSVYDTLGLDTFTVSVNGGAAQPITPVGNTWSFSQDNSSEGYFELVFTAIDDMERQSSLSRSIIIDTIPPIVEFDGVVPVVGTNTVNSIISWSGLVSEENIDTFQYQLPGGSLTDLTITNNKWEVTGIDTTAANFTEDAVNNLRIYAIDKAGNTTDILDPIYVDQDSDRPSFSYTNVDSANDTLAEADANLLETGAKIIGTISDDDGVDFSTIQVTVYNGDDSVRTATAAISNPPAANGTYVNWSHDLSTLSDGVYYAVFTTNDINGLPETTGRVYFTIDLNPAALTVDFPATGSYQSAGFNITGTASDANGLMFGDHDSDGGAGTAETDYIEISDDGGTSWVNVPVDAMGDWIHPVSAPANHSNDGLKNYQVRATDVFGKSSTETLDFTIDTLAPSMTINSPVDNEWTNVSIHAINGVASDVSGVVSVEVSTDSTDGIDGNWSTVNGTVSWNNLLDISLITEQENKLIYFRSTDIAGNVTTDTRTINIDRTEPTLAETAVNTGVPVYRTADYTLSGTLTDNLANSLPTYDHDTNGGTAEIEYIELVIDAAAPVKIDVNAGSWTYPVTFAGGTFNYELAISDKAGNTSSYLLRTIIADNSVPSLDDISSPTGAEQFISGSAYSISGSASDIGVAGLNSVYWWVGPQGNAAPAATSPYTGWTAASGMGSWTGSLDLGVTGEGDKTLHVFTVDNAGNISPVITEDFTVDQAAPVMIEDGLAGTNIISNSDISLELTVTETNGIISGDLLDGGAVENVEYFEIMHNGLVWATDAVRIEYTGDDMIHTITAAELADGNNEILIRVTDLAGRVSSIVKRDVFFDDVPPSVSYINVNVSSVVNGETFNIQGTTSDTASTITAVTIAVNGPGDGAFGIENAVSGSPYSWNYDLDLTPSGTYYTDDPISVRVTATDSAGNSVVVPLTFAIDQQEDMPTLSLSGLSSFTQFPTAMVTVDDYVLTGVLFDADGVDLDSLVVNVDSEVRAVKVINGVDNDTAISWFADLSDKVPATYTYSVIADDTLANSVSGNYSGMIDSDIPILGADAKITGSAEDDDAFDSSTFSLMQNGSDLSGSAAIGGDSTYVPWSYTLPAADDLYYFEINGADASVSAIPVDWAKYGGESLKTMVIKDSGSPVVTITSPSQGAYVNGSVVTSGEAYDDLAINTLTITAFQSDNVTSVELTSDPGVALDQTENTGEFYYDTAAGKYVWDFALERLPDAYENDSITLLYEAEDIVGNSTVRERSITIDTVDPLIDIQYPSDGALVTGDITIQGITYDEKIDTVEIRCGNAAVSGGAWVPLSGTYNWNTTFNSVATAVIDDSTDNGDGTYNYPVEIRATDAAGNQTTLSSYSFNISPDMDKPVLSVTTPADNSTLGGAILFIGTATDNEAVADVYARIDINGDGDYDDSFDLNNANSTNDDFEREGTWYEISDFQNSVWKLQINGDSTLYRSNAQITGTPEDYIHIEFKAIDIEGSESIVMTRTLTLDETFPDISNFGLSGGGTDISGNINLIADITDNEGITNIDISYNGGLSYESVYAGSTLSYTLDLNKDSETPVGSGGLGYTDSSAIVKVRLKVTDTTGYQSFNNLELNVDNVVPTGSYTGKVNDIGNAGGTGDEDIVTISGTAKDIGIVSSFDRVEVYIVQDSNVITPLSGAIGGTTSIDFNDGNGSVPYPSNASDIIVIDETQEQGVTDTDGDGFIEDISYASGETNWATWFDTGNIDSNTAVEVHYVIYDKAGNASHYVEIMLIVGSDLDGDDIVEASEKIAYPQAFQARRGWLYFELFGGSKAGFNIEVDDNLGNATITTTASTTQVTIDTSSLANYPEGDAVFTLRVYDGVDLKITKTLSVDIKGADVDPPVLSMIPLTQSSVVVRNIDDKNVVFGHLDQGDTGNGPDYDISGIVKFEGTVTDDTMIQDIILNVEGEAPMVLAEWDTGLFTAKNGAEINSQIDWKTGHSVSFSYEWDSSIITNTAELDLNVTFTVRDYTNPDVTDVTGYDIVPYISSISRTGFNTNRSRLGFYPLRRGETGVQIDGYNLRAGGLNDSVLIGVVSTANSSAAGVITTDIPATATSGKLTVTVNSVVAINNVNSNASSYNRENNAYVEGTELWTDDRYVHVWQSDDNQTGGDRGYFNGSDDPIHPAMTIDDSGLLYASWSNYALSDVLMNTNASGTTTQIFSSYDPAEHTDISFGSDISVVYNANTYGNQSWSTWGAGGVELWSNSNDRTFAMEELYHNEMLMQFINQRAVTVGTVTHITYYDTQSDSLKYDRKLLTGNQTGEQITWINIDGFYDGDDGTRVVGGTGSRTASMNAGEYSSIDVTPGTSFPVIAYYDLENQKLKLAYSDKTNPGAADWTVQDVTTTGSYTGKYVSMRIDSSGYIHLAYYKTSTGDLCYIKSTNSPTDGNTAYTFGPEIVLDSIGSVGMWADVTLNGTTPVISYLDSSKVNTFDGLKVATIETAFDTNYDGIVNVDDEIWETQNLPLAYEVDSKRLSIEYDKGSDNLWDKAIGYASSDYYRIAYYVPE